MYILCINHRTSLSSSSMAIRGIDFKWYDGFFLSMLATSVIIVIINWQRYHLCTYPLHIWIVVDYTTVFVFCLLMFVDNGLAAGMGVQVLLSCNLDSSSACIFAAIFAPPSKVLGRESLRSESMEKKQQDYTKEAWNNTRTEAPGENSKSYETDQGQGQGTMNRDMYQEQRVQPCHLSSSIYYGGQDIYSQPQNSQGYGSNSVYKKDGGEDDSGSASGGNWFERLNSTEKGNGLCGISQIKSPDLIAWCQLPKGTSRPPSMAKKP